MGTRLGSGDPSSEDGRWEQRAARDRRPSPGVAIGVLLVIVAVVTTVARINRSIEDDTVELPTLQQDRQGEADFAEPLKPAKPRPLASPSDPRALPPLEEQTGAVVHLVSDDGSELLAWDVDRSSGRAIELMPPLKEREVVAARSLFVVSDALVYDGGGEVQFADKLGRSQYSFVADRFVPAGDGRIWFVQRRAVDDRDVVELRDLARPDDVLHAAVSPSGLVVGAAASRLVTQQGAEVVVWDPGGSSPTISIGGRLVAAGGDVVSTCDSRCEEVVITDVRRGRDRVIDLVPAGVRVLRGSVSPDGRYLALSVERLDPPTREHRLLVLELRSDESWLIAAGHLASAASAVHPPVWSVDSGWVFQIADLGDSSPGVVAYRPGDATSYRVPSLSIESPARLATATTAQRSDDT